MADRWWQLNNPLPDPGKWPWDWQEYPTYPGIVPIFRFIKAWARRNNLDGNGWQSGYTVMQDVEFSIPPTSAVIGGEVQQLDNMVQLFDYPMDEVPAAYVGTYDRIEIWTGQNRTGDKFTELNGDTISGPIPSQSYIVDYASGTIRFSNDDVATLVWVSYFGLQGANRSATLNLLTFTTSEIVSGLLNGLLHPLNFKLPIQPGTNKYIDFSQVTGTPGLDDWVYFIGDAGGVLPRDAGLRAGDLTLFVASVMPATDPGLFIGKYNSSLDSETWQQGGFKSLSASTELLTPLLHGVGDLLTIDDGVKVELPAGATFLVDGGVAGGSVTVDDNGKITLDVPSPGADADAFVSGDASTEMAISAKGRIRTTQEHWVAFPVLLGGQFDNLIAYNQSNAINATGFAMAGNASQFLFGSYVKPRTLFMILSSTASEGVVRVRLFERDEDNPSVNYLWDSGTIDWSGAQATYNLPITLTSSPARSWGIEVTCANSVANAVRIIDCWVDVDTEYVAT